jgi:hypothetical protein
MSTKLVFSVSTRVPWAIPTLPAGKIGIARAERTQRTGEHGRLLRLREPMAPAAGFFGHV